MGYIQVVTGSMAIAMIVPLVSYLFLIHYSYIGSAPRGNLYETDVAQPVISH
jgi:fucose permease